MCTWCRDFPPSAGWMEAYRTWKRIGWTRSNAFGLPTSWPGRIFPSWSRPERWTWLGPLPGCAVVSMCSGSRGPIPLPSVCSMTTSRLWRSWGCRRWPRSSVPITRAWCSSPARPVRANPPPWLRCWTGSTTQSRCISSPWRTRWNIFTHRIRA